jgi:hypothetical protein
VQRLNITCYSTTPKNYSIHWIKCCITEIKSGIVKQPWSAVQIREGHQ